MIVIVDYGVGNLTSIQNMFKKAGVEAVISSRVDDVMNASKLMLPGMGHFDNCMQKFNGSGLRPVAEKMIFDKKVPVLGICVGLQMFMRSSEEGREAGLGWIEGETIRFRQEQLLPGQKIPNLGWLDVQESKPSSLLTGLNDARFYFAHTFHVVPADNTDDLLHATYVYSFSAGVERNNIMGVQFHPEKSHRFGMQLLKNFAENY